MSPFFISPWRVQRETSKSIPADLRPQNSPHLNQVDYQICGGETLCHDIYPARPITTVSVAANTHCMMDGHSSYAPRTVDPRVQFSGACEQSHWWLARHTAGGHLLSVVQAATNIERLWTQYSQRSQIKEDTVEPSVPAREFNLTAYAAITWHNDRARPCLEPGLADHRNQAVHTVTLPTVPPRQASQLCVQTWYFF